MNVTWKPNWINKTITKFLLELHCVKKCPYLECFWSVFSCIRPEHGGRLANWKRHEVKYWENIPLFVQLRFFTLLLHFWQFDIRKKLKWSFFEIPIFVISKKDENAEKVADKPFIKGWSPAFDSAIVWIIWTNYILLFPLKSSASENHGFSDRFRGNRSYSIRLNLANIGENP